MFGICAWYSIPRRDFPVAEAPGYEAWLCDLAHLRVGALREGGLCARPTTTRHVLKFSRVVWGTIKLTPMSSDVECLRVGWRHWALWNPWCLGVRETLPC